jgi:hypothetical protein
MKRKTKIVNSRDITREKEYRKYLQGVYMFNPLLPIIGDIKKFVFSFNLFIRDEKKNK